MLCGLPVNDKETQRRNKLGHCEKYRNSTKFPGVEILYIWKLCLSTKFPHQEIRRNYSIFRSGGQYKWYLKVKSNLKNDILFANRWIFFTFGNIENQVLNTLITILKVWLKSLVFNCLKVQTDLVI